MDGNGMDGNGTRRLREDLGRVERELAAAEVLERRDEERHEREGSAQTEAVLEARRTRADLLGRERERLAGELELRGSPGGQPRGPRGTGA